MDDDDDDDLTFLLVDKLVEEHNAKKALVRNFDFSKPSKIPNFDHPHLRLFLILSFSQTQLQSQVVSPILERQAPTGGTQAVSMRPGPLNFPAPPSQQIRPQVPVPSQVRPHIPMGPPSVQHPVASGPPAGRITQAAAQLRAEMPVNQPPLLAGAPLLDPMQIQQRLGELEGNNKLLRSNLDNVELEKLALRKKVQELESRSIAPAQAATMAELQRNLEQLKQELVFKDQELMDEKRKAASNRQTDSGMAPLAAATAQRPISGPREVVPSTSIAGRPQGLPQKRHQSLEQPENQQQQQQQQQDRGQSASERVKRRANGVETPATPIFQPAGIALAAPISPPIFTLPPMEPPTDSPAEIISRLWASCPEAMSFLLSGSNGGYGSFDGGSLINAGSPASGALHHVNNTTRQVDGISGVDFDSEVSQLRARWAGDLPRAAAGLVHPTALLGTLATLVCRVVCSLNGNSSSGSGAGNNRNFNSVQRDKMLNLASAALTVMQHLILEDSGCRHAALASCGCPTTSLGTTTSESFMNSVRQLPGEPRTSSEAGGGGIFSNRITFSKPLGPVVMSALSASNYTGAGVGYNSRVVSPGIDTAVEAALRMHQLSLEKTTAFVERIGITTTTVANGSSREREPSAGAGPGQILGLQALCISAALLPGKLHSGVLSSVAGLASALVISAPLGPSRAVFLPLITSGAVAALLRNPILGKRTSAVALLQLLLQDSVVSSQIEQCAAARPPNSPGGGGATGNKSKRSPLKVPPHNNNNNNNGNNDNQQAQRKQQQHLQNQQERGVSKLPSHPTGNTPAPDGAAAATGVLTMGNTGHGNNNNNGSWAKEVMLALLNCLRLVHGPAPATGTGIDENLDKLGGLGVEAGVLFSNALFYDETVLARATLSTFALLLEKKCSACFAQVCPGDEAASGAGPSGVGNSSITVHGNNNKGQSAITATAAVGVGGGRSFGNNSNGGNNLSQEPRLISLPVQLISLAEESVRYRGDGDHLTLVRTAPWPQGDSPAVRAAQQIWQRRLRLAQEALTLMRGLLILTGDSLAYAAIDELLSRPAMQQRMLAATGRLSRVESPYPVDSNQPLIPPLPVAAWVYAIGSSSNAASMGPSSGVERRAGLPCCSAADVSYLARGIKNRILYRLRS